MIFLPLKDLKYKQNQTIIKVYGNGNNRKIKVTTFRLLRTAGVEDDLEFHSDRCSVNDSKLDASINRAKSKIFELAFCNEWQFFFTGTLDPRRYVRSDLETFHKDLTQWITNQRKKFECDIKYLLIPELHSDGQSWHVHGFISGIPQSELQQYSVGMKMGKALSEKVQRGDVVYNWLGYSKKFGFCDVEPIRNSEAVSKYVTKYINKNLACSVRELNAHIYYHSRGLKTAQTIKKGTMLADIVPSYSNDYCSIAWLDYSDELLAELQASFVDIDYISTRTQLCQPKASL